MRFPVPLPPQLFVLSEGISPGASLRVARAGDLYDLHRTCYPHLTRVYLRTRLQYSLQEQARGRRVHLVAELAGEGVVGTGQLIGYTGSRVEIANLVVAERYRGYGLGSALICVLVKIALHTGFQTVEIGVLLENERALALYKRLGFLEVKQMALPGQGKAVVLEKKLRSNDG